MKISFESSQKGVGRLDKGDLMGHFLPGLCQPISFCKYVVKLNGFHMFTSKFGI